MLGRGRYTVIALIEDGNGGDECRVLDFLTDASSQYSGSVKGLKVLFQRYGQLGRNGLTTELFHEVSKNEQIWEFIKGDLRVFCFKDPHDGSVVVLSHAIIKKGRKTKESDVTKAKSARNVYLAAKVSGKLQEVRYVSK